MKKIFFFVSLLLSLNICVFSNLLINEELYYNSDKSVFQGKKRFFYDDKNNIITIKTYNSDDIEEAKVEYTYEENTLITAIEYNGKTKIKYSEFLYSSDRLIKKIEFDINGKILLTHNFIYDGEFIIAIEDFSGDNIFLGKKEFKYDNNILTQELQFDEKNKIFMTKKYLYKENLLYFIEFYLQKNRLIRVIEKRYSEKTATLNLFYYKNNFFDFR